MSIQDKVAAYYGRIGGGHPGRYRSWEHCFQFFQRGGISARRDEAALQLGFYLASWGMYRGSSFLLQYDYTVHLPVVERLAAPAFQPLWENEVGVKDSDLAFVPLIDDAIKSVRHSYAPIGNATDTLVTKILLGVLGCLPACDRFFIDGYKSQGLKYSYLHPTLVGRLIQFCLDHRVELQEAQARIQRDNGIRYPLMKLADMYFWQLGFELDAARNGLKPVDPVPVV